MNDKIIFFICIVCLGHSFKFFHINNIIRKNNIINNNIISSLDASTETVNTAETKSFVRDELRPYAMNLHTRDQAPKEGKQEAKTPFTQWQVARSDYLHFLVDSLSVYEALEDIVEKYPELSAFRDTGLERSEALRKDIKWLSEEYDPSLEVPPCGEPGQEYSKLLYSLAKESLPKFMCHYYNHYFAHTAGGRMIGKRLSDQLLEGHTLEFYKWERAAAAAEAAGGKVDGVKALLGAVQNNIDAMARTWSDEEKQQCCAETMACFKYGGSLMSYMSPNKN